MHIPNVLRERAETFNGHDLYEIPIECRCNSMTLVECNCITTAMTTDANVNPHGFPSTCMHCM